MFVLLESVDPELLDNVPTPLSETGSQEELYAYFQIELAKMPELQSKVVQMRYGIPDGKGQTVQEVAKALGLPRERVRRIEAKALQHFRHPLRKREILEFFEQ